MLMAPPVRKAFLTLHVIASVGWLGSVAAFLVLSVVAAYGADAGAVRTAFLAMNIVGWYAVVPLNVLAVVTGLVQAVGTPWGLLRYYWISVKLVLTVIGTGLLLMHQTMVGTAAASMLAGSPLPQGMSLHTMGVQLVWDAGLGLFLLTVLTVLSVFKPWGMTQSALRRQSQRLASAPDAAASFPASLKVFLVGVVLALLFFMMLHMPNHSMGHHHA